MKHSISVAAIAIVLLSGCGYKDDPIPPQSVVPMAIEDLRYKIDGNNVTLQWSYPVKTIKGGAITDIAGFQLYRAGIPLDEYCKTCPVPFGSPQKLPGGASYDGEQRRVASFTSAGMKPGYKYFFKVSSRTGWLAASPDSNVVSFVFSMPPASPENLTGKADNGEVSLSWQTVNTLQNGQALLGPVQYQVLRDGNIIAGPFAETSYIDRQVANGSTYNYSVQAVMSYSGEPVPSSPGPAITLQPKDTIAPQPPTGAHAVATSEGIKIFWDAATSNEIAEYRIYRRANGEKKYTLLGEVKPIYTIYTDSSAKNNSYYQYVITAVDDAGNESLQSQPASPRN